jgi:putative redox protein
MIIKAKTHLVEDNVFETDVNGVKVTLDTGSGKELGQSPVHVVLSALASCSAVDIVEIIRKKRKNVTAFLVETTGDRLDPEDGYPRKFRHIQLNFKLSSTDASLKDLEQAASLSLEKYCSVYGMLIGNTTIAHSVELIKV